MKVENENAINNSDKIIYKGQGCFAPKEEEDIFVKNNDEDMKGWNKISTLPRGDLQIIVTYDLPRTLSDHQLQTLKAIYQ